MINDLKFISWKLAELITYLFGFPFLFIGAWCMVLSDWFRGHAQRVPL